MKAPTKTSQGFRIRELLRGAADNATIVSPFIKVDALRSLLSAVSADVHVRCVTRWLPRDIAAGVSDPEIIDVLEERGDCDIGLVDRLHAKLYIADDRCLAGSVNVTWAGLGESGDSGNLEVLVESSTADAGVAATLEDISREERSADRTLALAARRLADSLPREMLVNSSGVSWFPRSRRADRAFRCYLDIPTGYVKASERMLLVDLAMFDLQPGLTEDEFGEAIRSKLATLPIAHGLLDATEDRMLTRAEAQSFLEKVASAEESTSDLWRSFLNWMAHFFPGTVMKQEISEVALRRGSRLLSR